jgi:hypothetical protein
MPEREPMHPELAAAMRAYELEVLDGTERSQKKAFEQLRQVRQRLGRVAVFVTDEEVETPTTIEPDEVADREAASG